MTKYDNSGVLFKNDKKQSDKQPDYRGNISVGGIEYWLSAWIKDGKKGKFLSLAVTPREERKKAVEAEGVPFDDDNNLKGDEA